MSLTCRVIGVSDLCDFPPEAAAKPKVSRSCFNSAEMTSAEVKISASLTICFCTFLYMLKEEDHEVNLNCQNEGHQSTEAFLFASSTWCAKLATHGLDTK